MSATNKHLRRGFTLLELMIVIAVITIMMMYAMPNMMGSKQTEDLKSATDDVINVFQHAKTRAAHAFVAYGVKYTDTEGGQLQVIPGTGPNCTSIDFAKGEAVKDLHFRAPTSKGGNWNAKSGKIIEIVGILPSGLKQLCFTPDGRFLKASDSTPVAPTLNTSAYQAGEYIVSLARVESGKALGIQHHVIVSYSGRARYTFGADHTSTDGEGY